jgi:hypothetical protein
MRVALSLFASSISASAARPWSILCPAQLTASGNILGKVFLNGCHWSRNVSPEGGPGFRSIPGQRHKAMEFARLGVD